MDRRIAQQLGRTPQEIVTIASLIETESGVEAERPIVASVIYNRLTKHMALGIDQTVVYIAKMENRWDGTINQSDLEANSPYNTRKVPGLPPGPDLIRFRKRDQCRTASGTDQLSLLRPQRRTQRRLALVLCLRRRI